MPERDVQGEGADSGLPRLPPGRHGLPRDFVVKNQRDRLTAGVIAAVAEHGYHATVSQICAAAGVSRRTFYSFFPSKEECYLQAFDLIMDHLVQAMGEAGAGAVSWPQAVRSRLEAMLAIFAANPDLALFSLIAPLRAGDRIAVHHRGALDRLRKALTGDPPKRIRSRASPAVEQALVGGITASIAREVERGQGEELPKLLPDLVELFLTPYVGRGEAVKASHAEA